MGLVGHRYDRRQVLHDVSLEANGGEIVCIIGKNGSGKTTLTRILSTLITPDRGEVRVCGHDTIREDKQVRKNIGVVLNSGESGFQPRLSGYSNLEYYGALYGVTGEQARKRVGMILAEVGLLDRGTDQYQSYSTGMRRRLALARALLSDPRVLILDEPTLGIDPWSIERVHELLRGLANRGKTILCATNNLSEAKNLGGRIFVLEDGILTDSATRLEMLTA